MKFPNRCSLVVIGLLILVCACNHESPTTIEVDLESSQDDRPGLGEQAGREFLERNKDKPGVITSESGLQYQILNTVDQQLPMPTGQDWVVFTYTRTMVDGTLIGRDQRRDVETTSKVDFLFGGLREAILEMRIGERRMLYVPPELAYGREGAGRVLGPDETIIVDVTLVQIMDVPGF